jgi:hypothetical protein
MYRIEWIQDLLLTVQAHIALVQGTISGVFIRLGYVHPETFMAFLMTAGVGVAAAMAAAEEVSRMTGFGITFSAALCTVLGEELVRLVITKLREGKLLELFWRRDE